MGPELRSTYFIWIEHSTVLSRKVSQLRNHGYELSNGDALVFNDWYSTPWQDLHLSWMTQLKRQWGTRRDQNSFGMRLRKAQFRSTKTLEQFDFERLPQLNRALVHDLATGRYVRECSPVLIVGPSGTGKSHLAQALGHCAVRQGTDVLFTRCSALTQTLHAARATNAYERKLQALSRIPVLIIDDFGLKPLRAPADDDLHERIAERYERTTTIVTSNLDFTEWDQAFPGNPLLASATLERLRHNAYCLTLDGQSYRTPRQMPIPMTTKTKKSSPKKESK